MKIDPNRAGLALGITFVVYHAAWLLSLLLGLGELWLNWVGMFHFVEVDYQLASFDLTNGVIGLVGAFILGYAMGWVFGYTWQLLGKRNTH